MKKKLKDKRDEETKTLHGRESVVPWYFGLMLIFAFVTGKELIHRRNYSH